MSSPFWIRLMKPRARWHRLRILSLASPHVTTMCGQHPDGQIEAYKSETGLLPMGITCRRCLPL